MRNHALAFSKKIRQDALVFNVNGLLAVGDVKAGQQRLRIAFDRAALDQAAKPEFFSAGNLFANHITGALEVQQVVL
jgi:hypothetical protein